MGGGVGRGGGGGGWEAREWARVLRSWGRLRVLSDPEAPFGVVTLASSGAEGADAAMGAMRIAQTAGCVHVTRHREALESPGYDFHLLAAWIRRAVEDLDELRDNVMLHQLLSLLDIQGQHEPNLRLGKTCILASGNGDVHILKNRTSLIVY